MCAWYFDCQQAAVREIKDSRMTPVVPSHHNSLHILSHAGTETQISGLDVKGENTPQTRL